MQVPGEPQRETESEIRVSIAPNPSHLEAVSPVVLGMVRAEQMRARDADASRIMGLLIHGDAAFSGLGLVSERANLLPTTRMLDDIALDKYSFVRDAYLQRRRSLVYDGNEPDEDEPAPPAPPAATPPPPPAGTASAPGR